MVKIDHERPSLKYLDNLRREIALSNRPADSGAKAVKPLSSRSRKILQKMEVLNLSSLEVQCLEEFLTLFNQRWDMFGQWLSQLSGKKRKNFSKKLDDIDAKLISSSLKLIGTGLIAQQNGKEDVFEWINLYVKFLHSIGADIEREHLTDVVFKQALERFEGLIPGGDSA